MSKIGAKNDVDVRDIAATSEVQRLLHEDNVPWYKKRNLRTLYLFLVPSALGVEITTGYDGSVLNGLQAVEHWQMHFGYPSSYVLGLVSASFSMGSVACIPILPFLIDGYGRRFCILLGSTIVCIGVIIQTLAINLPMLIASRAIMGVGMPIALSGAAQLLAELCYPKERGAIIGLFQTSWYVGSIIAAGTTLGTYWWPSDWSWRLPTLFQLLPSILQLAFVWFVPESPRWLISKDRHEEALEILVKYHAEGDASSPFVAAEFQQISETLRLEKDATQHQWSELVTNATNIRRCAVALCVGLFSQWAGNGLVSYYLAKVLASVGITERKLQNQLNLGLNCWNLVTGVTAAALGTRYLNRRTQILTGYGSMTIIFACWTAASAVFAQDSTNNSAAIGVVALIFIYYAFYNLMMPCQYLYVSEVFPFIHRSKGIALMQLMNKGGGAFNQFVNPISLDSIQWRYYIVYVAILFLETTTIYFLYPETKGVSLEEVAIVMEGDKARVVGVGKTFHEEKEDEGGQSEHVKNVTV